MQFTISTEDGHVISFNANTVFITRDHGTGTSEVTIQSDARSFDVDIDPSRYVTSEVTVNDVSVSNLESE